MLYNLKKYPCLDTTEHNILLSLKNISYIKNRLLTYHTCLHGRKTFFNQQLTRIDKLAKKQYKSWNINHYINVKVNVKKKCRFVFNLRIATINICLLKALTSLVSALIDVFVAYFRFIYITFFFSHFFMDNVLFMIKHH